jgi:formylglycine-generating enzyme required for sulfatase activity
MQPRVGKIVIACLLLLGAAWVSAAAQPVPASPEAASKAGAEIANSIGMKLVYIPPGKFMMGSPKEEKGRFDDEEQHEVEITKGFYLGKYEVTQEEYEKVTGKNPSTFKGPKLPVETVGWSAAKEFCRLLSLKEGKGGKDGRDGTGYRLPTEAEWELACRAGMKTPYHFGETISLEQANYYNPNKNGTVEVGKYAPNAWGLHDMHGNVWEWCEDPYAPDIHKNSLPQDPRGPLKGNTERRVTRGGSWGSDPSFCRSAARYGRYGTVSGNIGFRVALSFVK